MTEVLKIIITTLTWVDGILSKHTGNCPREDYAIVYSIGGVFFSKEVIPQQVIPWELALQEVIPQQITPEEGVPDQIMPLELSYSRP